ncbi:MAG TPA: hypothetical protein VHW03_01935 [Chthoniobacterales bacterium]|nr:hypothetical protein [Chthoniobacterales bacterium]
MMRDFAMKKLLLVVVAALVIALGLWIAFRVVQANRALAVAELLPKTTLFLAEVPDFKSAREQWRSSDLHAIWREPAVQTWLQKPFGRLQQNQRGRQMFDDFLRLRPTDGFVALTSIEKDEPKLVGGFHFDASAADVRSFVQEYEGRAQAKSGGSAGETITYQQHQIETVDLGRFVVARVYDRDWFFVANDVAALKALLDRADRLSKAPRDSLRESDAFQGGTQPLPAHYAAMVYLAPQPLVERVLPLVSMAGQSAATAQLQKLKEVRSVAGTLGFANGKMSEATFVAMPRRGPEEKVSRPSLPAADANTFFYSDALLHWLAGGQLTAGSSAIPRPAFLQQFSGALVRQGITQADLQAAFGDEMELIGQWPPGSRWPTLLASLPVRDAARARKIADALTSVEIGGSAWARTQQNGVNLYNLPGLGGLIPVTLTLAVSDKKLVAGSDATAVAAAVQSTPPPAEPLEKNERFRDAAAQVPAAGSAFDYIDTRLLFERIDASLRPLLVMSAAIYPALGNKINVAQLPPPDAIAKHLSPIVMSQRYTDGGYLSESVGPITFNEATIGAASAVGALYIYWQRNLHAGSLFQLTQSAPAATPSPTATPTASPF